MTLKNKTIILGVTGGISAYKAIELTRLLTKAGADVWPVMTDAAREFIGPLSLATLSGNPVGSSLFKENSESRINHIELAERADLVIIAPATANTIGKLAGGIADDLLSTLILATAAPILVAPAMNHRMYENKAVQSNIERLKGFGTFSFVGPEEGELACGSEGPGRLSPVEDILSAAERELSSRDLLGETVLVTAGATRELIDPVRFFSNGSSGKMGYAIAKAALAKGARVILVSGQTVLGVPDGVDLIEVTSAEDMHREAMAAYKESTIVIMAAAVADYRPIEKSSKKIKKSEENLMIEMERTRDILSEMGKDKGARLLVGFALETDNIIENAKEKLKKKNLDMIVANSTEALASGVNRATILYRDREAEALPTLGKSEVAELILDRVYEMRVGDRAEGSLSVAPPLPFNKVR